MPKLRKGRHGSGLWFVSQMAAKYFIFYEASELIVWAEIEHLQKLVFESILSASFNFN